MFIPKSQNLSGYVKKVVQWGSLSLLLWLVPSVANAHDFKSVWQLFFGLVMVFQLLCGVIMLARKRKELMAHRFVVSGLYVGILSLLWWVILYPRSSFESMFGPDWGIGLGIIFLWVLPIAVAPLLAWALYRKFREPLSSTEIPNRDEGQ